MNRPRSICVCTLYFRHFQHPSYQTTQYTSKSYLIFWNLIIYESLPIKCFRIFLQEQSEHRILTVSIFRGHPVQHWDMASSLFRLVARVSEDYTQLFLSSGTPTRIISYRPYFKALTINTLHFFTMIHHYSTRKTASVLLAPMKGIYFTS